MYPDNQQHPGQFQPAPAQRPPWHGAFEADVLRLVGDALKLHSTELTLDVDMANYGDSSIHVTTIMSSLAKFYGIAVPPAVYFEVSSVRELCQVIGDRHGEQLAGFYQALPGGSAAP
ncbi:acyl carrier protein [Pseudomonas sp. MSSRFD41]|uniref:acyl carrier protein n=1 Tax=unclassified Pseudomonas TaxID=196821 RepID=UPI00163A2C3F|nr:acyl carrier protein [Pseudomonas sp. MSSRFD41]MBC2660111.1 acyl carrier protein [Pseudomonas sp. MSSRFD41]